MPHYEIIFIELASIILISSTMDPPFWHNHTLFLILARDG